MGCDAQLAFGGNCLGNSLIGECPGGFVCGKIWGNFSRRNVWGIVEGECADSHVGLQVSVCRGCDLGHSG